MQDLDLSNMNLSELSEFIIQNPSVLDKFEESDLQLVQNKLNPYNKPIGQTEKTVLFSYMNPQIDRLKLLSTYSLFRFMKQLVSEFEDWKEDVRTVDPSIDLELFKSHMETFSKVMLTYDEKLHCMDASHTKKDVMPSLDFISRWERFESHNLEEIEEVISRNVLYKKAHQCALQVYDVFDKQEEAKAYIDKNAKTIGVDILMASTNKWTVLQDAEYTNVEFVGEQNQLINTMLTQMKQDKTVGEAMVKKRMQRKRDENEKEHGPVDPSVKQAMPQQIDTMSTYRQQKLDLCSDEILNPETQESFDQLPILKRHNGNIEKGVL